jgi:predicted nucleic acid-binding protein
MNLVVDTSVLIAVMASEPERVRIVQLTQGADLLAPASVHWEVGNALAAMLKRKRIDADQLRPLIRAYEKIPIRFIDVDMEGSLEIAASHDLYAYDAYVIACARENRCKVISLDKGLLHAARSAGVGLLEVPS